MGSPGGPEVGRVSVRVVPDTNQFRRELKAKLEGIEQGLEVNIPVNLEIDEERLRAQLAALERSRITIPVDLEPDTAKLRAQLEALDNLSRVTIPVDLQVDPAQLAQIQAALASIRDAQVTLSVDVRGLTGAIAQLEGLESLVRRLDGRTIVIDIDVRGLAAAVAQMGALEAASAAVGGSLDGARNGVDAASSSFSLGARNARLLALALAAAVVVAPLLAVAGAAITAAWGTVATAIAAVNPAIALIGAPIAAVVLGLDGIKKAAQSIAPEFEKLKASVSATFERGMLPVFKQLATAFPQLTTGMNGIATAMSGVALKLANFITSANQLPLIEAMFAQVSVAITNLGPGLQDIVDGFIRVASLSDGFSVLTSTINTFGAAFKASVIDLISDGTLQSAFAGLEAVLGSLTRGFVQLVDNGIRVFAAAAPGVTQLLDSLTAFFERFDWTALGTAVSDVFSGIAETLNQIPTSTIDAITKAFQDLAAVFQDPTIQQGFAGLAAGIPVFINAVSGVIEIIGRVSTAVQGLDLILSGAIDTIALAAQGLADPIGLISGKFEQGFRDAQKKVQEGARLIGLAFADLGPTVGASASAAAATAMAPLEEAFKQFGTATLIPGLGDAFQGATTLIQQQVAAVGTAATTELEKLPSQIQGALAGVAPAVQQSFASLGDSVTAGMASMNQAVTTGSLQLQTAMAQGLSVLGDTVRVSFEGLGPFVTAGMFSIQTAINAKLLEIREAFRVGFEGFGPIAETAFASLTPFITAGLFAIQTEINAKLLEIREAFRVGFEGLGPIVQTAFATLAPFVTSGMFAIQTAINTSLLEIREAFRVGFEGLAPGIAEALFQVQVAVNTAMIQIRDAIRIGLEGSAAIIVAQGAAMAGAMSEAMFAVQLAVNTAMVEVGRSVQVGLDGAVAVMAQAGAAMSAAMDQAMTAVQVAVNTGMINARRSIDVGVSGMVARLNSAVGEFRAAGANMGQALADGLNSKVGAVQAAAARLAAAAAAATRAAAGIRSPSRVFMGLGDLMGQGLAVGLENSEPHLIRAAQRLVDGLSTEFSSLDAQLPDPGIDAWTRSLEAGVRRSMVETSVPVEGGAAGAQSGGPAIGTIIVNNPVEERASSSIARKARDLAELGVFSA